MDELDLFRDFRRGVAPPSEDARRRAAVRLASAVDDDRTPQGRVVQLIRKRPGFVALGLAALAGATAAALFLSTPWNRSPGFLERAQAALTPPEHAILHMKWEVISSVTDPACTVTRGPNQLWIDQVPPYGYRAILHDPPPAGADFRSLGCSSGTRREVGGMVDPACSPAEQPNCTTQETLEFEPPNTLYLSPLQFVLPPDPVAMLRQAISSGNAHDEGTTRLHGRTVERIRIDSPSTCALPSCPFGHVYVDPETFHPVEVHAPPQLVLPPPDSDDAVPPVRDITGATGRLADPLAQIDVVDRYLTFEYLPRTDANLALTDIQAQHPGATVVDPLDEPDEE